MLVMLWNLFGGYGRPGKSTKFIWRMQYGWLSYGVFLEDTVGLVKLWDLEDTIGLIKLRGLFGGCVRVG